MSDVLGNALRRIRVNEPSVLPLTLENPPLTNAESTGCYGDEIRRNLPAEVVPASAEPVESYCPPGDEPVESIDGIRTAAVADPVSAIPLTDNVESYAAGLPVQNAARHNSRWATRFGSATRLILTHRRQSAAAVILVCMTGIALERDSGPDALAVASDPEFADAEDLVSEFASLSSGTLREPAEPMEPSSYDGSLGTDSQGRFEQLDSIAGFPQSAASTAAVAEYPDQLTGSSSPMDMRPSLSPPGKVRFTGQIEPLN